MKFFLFSDFHFSPNGYLNPEIEGLRKFQRVAEEKNCDMMLHLGDLCHGPTHVMDFVEEYNSFHIPSYHCIGNHDVQESTRDEVVKAYRMPDHHYILDNGGYRFIIADTNFFYDEKTGEYVPYDKTNYYGVKTRETLPPEEIAWIKESIEASPYPCILCSHASFERYDSVKNGEAVRAIIDEANKKKPHSVIMVMNGHHHKDHVSIINNVVYMEVASPAFECAGSPPMPPHDKFPKEIYEKKKLAGWIVAPSDPLYYVVTLEGTAIDVEGCEPTTMFCGVGHKELGMPEYDSMGRRYTPYVSSMRITLG